MIDFEYIRRIIKRAVMCLVVFGVSMTTIALDIYAKGALNDIENTFEEYPKYQTEDVNSGREIIRERPVLEGENLWSIAEEIYGDPYKWIEIYEQNKDIIGEDPGSIYKGQFLQIPEDNSYFYSDYETCYEDAIAETFHWEGIESYIAPDCGYEIQNCIFYYTFPEGEGEQFKICYPRLIAHNGKDVSAVNAGIRERAMKMADQLLINRSQELSDSLLYDERYSTKWIRSSVNYVITYLDEDVISVVFQDYRFIGSIFGEDISMRTYVADINTGIRYQNEELLKSMDDLKIAYLIYKDMLLQHADSKFDKKIFKKVLTPQLMAEALQTNGAIDGRHFMNIFLTKDGVGFSFSYRVGQEIDGSYSIMRGWTKTILPKEKVAAHMTDAPVWGDWLKLRELYKEPTYFLKDIDWEKFQAKLPEKEAETLQKYLPVLTGGEFAWIDRSFASDNDPHEPRQAVIQDLIDEVEPQEVMVDSILFADVFQSGTQDVILYFPIIGGHYLILHEEDGVIYGIDYPVRWFQDLQENGLYFSSGGISYQVYHRMTFENGDYTDHIICKLDDTEFFLNGEKLGNTLEESAALFDAWCEENTQHPVKRYNPFDVD